MVTEKSGFIGTSNWSGDYFTDTAGVSIIFEPDFETTNPRKGNLLQTLETIFQRDYNSNLAKSFF